MKEGLKDGLKTHVFDEFIKFRRTTSDAVLMACVKEAECEMECAVSALMEAIENQYYVRHKKDRSVNAERENLKTFQHHARRAYDCLGGIPQLKEVAGQIDYFADFPSANDTPEENLPLLVAHLNPQISRNLDEKRKKKESKKHRMEFGNCPAPVFTPQFEHLYDANVNFLYYFDAGPEYSVTQVGRPMQQRNPGLADQAMDKVTELRKMLDEEQISWFQCGVKSEVPKCACHVGHYCGCGCDCYVWVMPEQMKKLRDFTLRLITLAPKERQDTFLSAGRGAAFSPGH